MTGAIRQEILTGIRDPDTFERLLTYLRDFHEEPPDVEDHEEAARCANRCLAAGIAAPSVDMLICAIALRRDLPIFTLDADFDRYARQLPLKLVTAEQLQRALQDKDS